MREKKDLFIITDIGMYVCMLYVCNIPHESGRKASGCCQEEDPSR